MCLQDYAIGFGTFASELQMAVQAADQILVGANPNRSLLIVTHPDANSVWVTTLGTAVAGTGWHLGTGDQPLVLDVCRYGNLPTKAFRIIAVGGVSNLSVLQGEFDIERAREFIRKLGA